MKNNSLVQMPTLLRVLFVAFVMSVASSSYATEYSSIDATKSKITFTSKLMGSKISGGFGKFSGKFLHGH